MVTYDFLAFFDDDSNLFRAFAIVSHVRYKDAAIFEVVYVLLKIRRKGTWFVSDGIDFLYDLIAKVCIFFPTDFVVHFSIYYFK